MVSEPGSENREESIGDTEILLELNQSSDRMNPSLEGSSTVNLSQDGSPSLTSNLEGSSVLIVTQKLNSSNYREWVQAVKLAIGGRGKLGIIIRDAKTPDPENAQAVRQWETDNSMVLSWLINAMTQKIKKSFMFLPTAREIWEAVQQSYSDGEDVSCLFEIKTKLWQMKQGDRDVTKYWLEMVALWQELDLNMDEEWRCKEDAVMYKQKVEKERVFEFLAGLNKHLDDVRGRILSRIPLPTTREVFSKIRREASQRKVMMKDETGSISTPEVSALLSRNAEHNPRNSKGKPVCDHCKKTGHTKDTCWEIHGKPVNWKPRKNKPRGYQATSDTATERQEESQIQPTGG